MNRIIKQWGALAALASSLSAASYTIEPSTKDLNDLDHYTPVIWGFNLNQVEADLLAGMVINSITVSLTNVRNWNGDPNALFINLIDNPYTAANSGTITTDLKYFNTEGAPESKFELNNFFTNTSKYALTGANAGQKVTYLTTYTDSKPGDATENWSYSLTQGQINTFTQYLGSASGFQKKRVNGSWVDNTARPRFDIGLGFDADCHYYNDGVKLTVVTGRVPDAGATWALAGLSLLGLAAWRRRQA